MTRSRTVSDPPSKRRKISNSGQNSIKIHKCSFIKPSISSILALAVTPEQSLTVDNKPVPHYLALSRSNGDVEIRASQLGWSPIYVIQGCKDRPITALEFASVRTVSSSFLLSSLTHNSGQVDDSSSHKPSFGLLWLAGFDGKLTLINFISNKIVTTLEPGGGVVWKIVANPSSSQLRNTQIAIASEDGRVRLITNLALVTEQSNTKYDSSSFHSPRNYEIIAFPKSEFRITALAWSDDGKLIAAGDAGGILNVFDVQSKQSISTMSISASGKPVIIWSCCFADPQGKVLISGDERGEITVWDTQWATAKQELHIEGTKGAILSLAKVQDEYSHQDKSFQPNSDSSSKMLFGNSLYKSNDRDDQTSFAIYVGAENGAVGALRKTVSGVWVPHRARLFHSGNVTAMVAFNPYLSNNKRKTDTTNSSWCIVTAGLDSRISHFTSSEYFQGKEARRFIAMQEPGITSRVKVISGSPKSQKDSALSFFAARSDDTVDLWRISYSRLDMSSSSATSTPQLALRMQPQELGGNITDVTFSGDMNRAAISAPAALKIYSLEDKKGYFQVKPFTISAKNTDLEKGYYAARSLIFLDSQGDRLAFISPDGRKIKVLSLKEKKLVAKLKETWKLSTSSGKMGYFTTLLALKNGNFIVAGDTLGNLHLFQKSNDKVVQTISKFLEHMPGPGQTQREGYAFDVEKRILCLAKTKDENIIAALTARNDLCFFGFDFNVDKKVAKLMPLKELESSSYLREKLHRHKQSFVGCTFFESTTYLYLYSSNSCGLIKLPANAISGSKQVTEQENQQEDHHKDDFTLQYLNGHDNIMGSGLIGTDMQQIVVVENSWDNISHFIPKVIRKKHYN